MTDHVPGTARRWLIRAGMAKASAAEIPWLVADLEDGDDRAVRRRWGAPVMFTASFLLFVTAALVWVLGDAGLPAPTWGPLLGTLFGATIGMVWAPAGTFRRRRRVALRLHGLDERGAPTARPTWGARLSPLGWSAFQAVGVISAITVLTVATLVWLRPWEVTVSMCEVRGDQLVATGAVRTTGRGYDPPDIEWVREDGSTIGSSRIVAAGDEFFVWFPLLGAPAPNTVRCRVT